MLSFLSPLMIGGAAMAKLSTATTPSVLQSSRLAPWLCHKNFNKPCGWRKAGQQARVQ
jgi:hypothetical protein